MLTRSGESGYPCLVPDLRRKAFSPSLLCMMFAVDFFTYGFYYVEVFFFYPSLLSVCIIKDVEFCQELFLHRDDCFSFFMFYFFFFL